MSGNFDPNNSYYQKSEEEATEAIKDPKKGNDILNDANRVSIDAKNNNFIKEVFGKFHALYRLVRAYINGEYTAAPWSFIVMAFTAIIYLVSPVDAIPDIIPAVGFADDAGVIAFVFASIKPAIDAFEAWERSKKK